MSGPDGKPTLGGLEIEQEPLTGDDGGGGRAVPENPPPARTFSFRHVLMVATLGTLTLLFVKRIGGAVETIDPADEDEAPVRQDPQPRGGFHEGNPKERPLGGAGAHGAKAPLTGVDGWPDTDFTLGDYEYFDLDLPPDFDNYSDVSPYADPRIAMTDDERHAEMKGWNEKMDAIREKYGYWKFHDPYLEDRGTDRPVVDFSKAGPLRDVSTADFPDDAWQSDTDYVRNFLREAKALVNRVQEAIYEEYGHGLPLTEEEKKVRKKNFGIEIVSLKGVSEEMFRDNKKFERDVIHPRADIAWMAEGAFEGLTRKLLHSMMTNDNFYAVMGGHSSAAGHGNNFYQSYMMQFHEVMEPVFDRLGMKLISRNMAQGGLGTDQTSMAGGGVYGESDFMMWDSSMTEGGPNLQDLFHRQAILSGDRVPVVFGSMAVGFVHNEAGAWVGGIKNIWNGQTFIATTKDEEQVKTLPYYVQRMFCDRDWGPCKPDKYNAVCWVDRTDVTPPEKQAAMPKGQASWHPGFRTHRYSGRKIALTILLALENAIDLWADLTETEGAPLADQHWHVTEEYAKIRARVAQRDLSTPSPCEDAMKFLPRICKVGMKGATEFTPNAGPSIRSLLKPAPNGYVPKIPTTNVYDGLEVKAASQRVPPGVVDVYAIASALPKGRAVDDSQNIRGRMLASSGVDFTFAKERQGPNVPELSSAANGRRSLTEGDPNDIVPGQGWTMGEFKTGICDGTYHSECARTGNCLMWGANDGRGFLIGDGLSGWLVMELKDLKEGIVFVNMQDGYETNKNPRTNGWAEVNNGKTYEGPPTPVAPATNTTNSTDSGETRKLKGEPSRPVPDDFIFEFAINGKITSWNKAEFSERRNMTSRLAKIWVLLDDPSVVGDVEVALRVKQPGRNAPLGISHVYWA